MKSTQEAKTQAAPGPPAQTAGTAKPPAAAAAPPQKTKPQKVGVFVGAFWVHTVLEVEEF